MRIAGIEAKVRAAALALYDPDGGLNAVETLAGREIANYIPNINQGVEDVSPARRLFMPQQVLEPMLLERAPRARRSVPVRHRARRLRPGRRRRDRHGA